MKILLAQNASYCPALGGANRSNRTLLEALHLRGHLCRVVATAAPGMTEGQLVAEGAQLRSLGDAVAHIACNGIEVFAARVRATMDNGRLRQLLQDQIEAFDPDWILVSSEDVGHVLLEQAVHRAAHKVVYLARTTLYLPFGPDCFSPSPEKAALLSHAAGIAVVGDFIKTYFKTWAGLDSEVLPISLFGHGPFPDYGNFDQGFITLINPCAYKGISIFLDLARSFPDISFAAVPTWGTTSQDMQAMLQQPNITVLDPVDDIDRILCRTRVMLVPSLWAEAKSRTIVEAMLRGIPVMASNVGGNPEAMLGVDYVLPVSPIQAYQQACDERSLPVTETPEQDCAPWRAALSRLLTDRVHYNEISRRARFAASEYVIERGGAEKVEDYLLQLASKSTGAPQPVFDRDTAAHSSQPATELTPAQRALLALRLKQRQPSSRTD